MNNEAQTITRVLRRERQQILPVGWIEELQRFGDYMAAVRGLTASSIEVYLHNVAGWMRYLFAAGLAPADAEPYQIIEWQKDLFTSHNMSAPARAKALTTVRQYYAWRELSGKPGNPAANVVGPKKPRRMPQKFTDDHLRAIFNAPDKTKPIGLRDLAILLFFFATGARRMEVANLCTAQLILKTNTGAVRFFGKGKKERIVSFEGPVVDELNAWMLTRSKLDAQDDAVFVSLSNKSKGKPLGKSGINDVLDRAMRQGGIKKTPDDPFGVHRLRSTFATAMYDAGVDIVAIQHLLGHEQVETTMFYIVISERQLKQRLPARVTQQLLEGNHVPRYVREKTKNRR